MVVGCVEQDMSFGYRTGRCAASPVPERRGDRRVADGGARPGAGSPVACKGGFEAGLTWLPDRKDLELRLSQRARYRTYYR